MSKTIYRARVGSHLNDGDAQTIGDELTRKFGDKKVRPGAVVNAARPKSSPLHGYFEWEDKEAAMEWRLDQARKILANILVVRVTAGGEEQETRAYHNVVVSNGIRERVYLPQHVVFRDADLRTQVLTEAARDADRAAQKLEQLEDLAGEAGALRQIAETVRAKAA